MIEVKNTDCNMMLTYILITLKNLYFPGIKSSPGDLSVWLNRDHMTDL